MFHFCYNHWRNIVRDVNRISMCIRVRSSVGHGEDEGLRDEAEERFGGA